MLWVVAVLSTFSTMHLLAHAVWAQAAMIVGAVQLAVVRGKLSSPGWSLVIAGALLVSGAAFLLHEQNPWLFSRSAFVHHAIGWTIAGRCALPARTGAAAATGRLDHGLRADVRRRRGAPLRRPGPGAHLRPPFRRRGAMRKAATLTAGLAAAVLVLPPAAAAHATLVEAFPGTQSDVRRAPQEIRLRFTEGVTVTPSAVQVLARDGAVLSGVATVSRDGRVVTAPVSNLRSGSSYTVRWRVAGLDGHSPAGVYTFGVGVSPPPPTQAVGASATTWRDDLARWALFVTLTLVIGPLAIRLVVLRGDLPPALEKRFHVVTTAAAFVVIDIGLAAFLVRASNALQLPVGDLLYGDLQPFAQKTSFGVAFMVMTVGFAVVAAMLALSWVFDRLWLRWPALALSVLLVSGLSLSGHQATEPNSSWASGLADWVHLVAASIWVGGLVTLAFLVWPAAPELRRRAFLGFSRLAVGLVGTMVLAGGYLAIVRLPELADLWETGYGQLLLLKLAVVGLALSWGGVHHLLVRPRIEAGDQPRVRPSLVGETAVAVAVLLVAAALTNASPPPPSPDLDDRRPHEPVQTASWDTATSTTPRVEALARWPSRSR